jgi:hypothetical protein
MVFLEKNQVAEASQDNLKKLTAHGGAPSGFGEVGAAKIDRPPA